MLPVEAAVAEVLKRIPRLPVERVSLGEGLHRLLAEEVRASGPLPPWPASAMDGFAVRLADVPGSLVVIETIPAGGVPTRTVGVGEASRIMTGAPVPDGADAVIMVEDTAMDGDRVVVRVSARPGQHIRPRGGDVEPGRILAVPGDVLTPGRIGMLAAVGVPSVRVAARPRVALISTGDEVIEPGFALGPGQIHSSNPYALAGLVEEAGGIPVDVGIARDDPEAIAAAFSAAAACDLVVSTGGVSVGDFDHVKGVLGDGLTFWRVAMKPGKPLAYGQIEGTPVFGLPGNPVSCMVNFLQFVRPVIRTMLGDPSPFLPVLFVEMDSPLKRQPGRPELARVSLRVEGGIVRGRWAGGHQGSGNVRSMAEGHGFALLNDRATEVGGRLPVQVFDHSFLRAANADYPWGGG